MGRSATANTTTLIDEWNMDVAETNTRDLIGLWSMDGALPDIEDRLGPPADAPAIVPAERARVCGTAYDVPILVKHPDEQTWRPLRTSADGVADEFGVAERLLGY
jgi:hypothetical protein